MKGTDAENDARIAELGRQIQALQWERSFLVERMRRRRKQRRQADARFMENTQPEYQVSTVA